MPGALHRIVALALVPVVAATARYEEPRTTPEAGSSEKEIAFASRRDGNWEIYIMDADGGRQTRLTHRPDDQDRFAMWSPDRSRIAFGSQVPPGFDPWTLWVMNADGSDARQVAANIVGKSNRAWTRDGKHIVYTASIDGDVEIFRVDVDTRRVTRLTTSPGDDRDPSLSPDGREIAFSSKRDGNEEIYVMRADGSGARRLTTNTGADLSPAWSPDGRAIAFTSRRDSLQDVYVMKPDGTNVRRLTTGARVTRDALQWSPDGTRIAFQMARGRNYDIGVVRVSDGARIDVAATGAYDGLFTWSPDGKQLAFISGRNGTETVWTVDADGRNARQLTSGASLNPAW